MRYSFKKIRQLTTAGAQRGFLGVFLTVAPLAIIGYLWFYEPEVLNSLQNLSRALTEGFASGLDSMFGSRGRILSFVRLWLVEKVILYALIGLGPRLLIWLARKGVAKLFQKRAKGDTAQPTRLIAHRA